MKYLVIVPDGMEDLPVPELGGRTPLEAARTPNMDHLARNGILGTVRTIPEGMPPGSDVGNLSALGYDPRRCFTGRAPFEAASLRVCLPENRVAFRCNFVSIVRGRMADYSAGHIRTEEAEALIRGLNEALESERVRFHPGKSYRHLLVLASPNPDTVCRIRTTPPHDILGKRVPEHLPGGKGAEPLLDLMERAGRILAAHPVNRARAARGEPPANRIWLWGQGKRPNLPSFTDRFQVAGSVISAVDLVKGIGMLAGLTPIDVPGITGYYDTNYRGKADYALRSLATRDFVFIHVEATDEAGHNGDASAKVEAIENIDRHIVGTIRNRFAGRDDHRILILSDHPTPVSLRTHSSDPVSFLLYGKGIPRSGSPGFRERAARAAGRHFDTGEDLIRLFFRADARDGNGPVGRMRRAEASRRSGRIGRRAGGRGTGERKGAR